MSAKLLYSLSDDNNPKQIGCINGFFQHFLSGRVVHGHPHHHHHKSLPPAGRAKMEPKDSKEVSNIKKLQEKTSFKNNNKETSRISTESSIVSSTSSTSSTLSPPHRHPREPKSSANSHQLSVRSSRKQQTMSNAIKHIDSPRPLQPSNLQNRKPLPSTDTSPRTQNYSSSILKDKKRPHNRRLSYDGRELRESMSLKLGELPRLSLDSKQGRIKSASTSASDSEFKSEYLLQQEELGSNRPVSSVVAKLMGLDDLPHSTPKISVRVTRSEDLDFVSSLTRSTDESDTESERHSVSIYKEIDKRLGELDFRKSGKDLRALKHILDAMQRTKSKMETENRIEEPVRESCTKSSGCVSLEQLNGQRSSNKGMAKEGSLPRVRTRQSANAKSDAVEKRRAKDLSPKTQQKCGKLEKFSQERRAGSAVMTSNKEQKTVTKQKAKSTRQNVEPRNKKVVDQCDMVHTPRPSQKLHKPMIEESATIMKEQPSPVSVLDADFYSDEALSPIKKKATAFRDDDSPQVSAQAEWIAMDTNHISNNTRSSFGSCNMGKPKEMPDSFYNIEAENDFLTSIIAKDLAKRSENWTDFCSENSWLVLDIERLLFKDLIVELVHGEASW